MACVYGYKQFSRLGIWKVFNTRIKKWVTRSEQYSAFESDAATFDTKTQARDFLVKSGLIETESKSSVWKYINDKDIIGD